MALLIMWSAIAFGDDATITVATLHWPPYSGKNLKNHGLSSEIIAEAFQRVGYRTRFVFLPWKRAMIRVAEGRHDALACAYYSKERDRIYAVSDSYAESPLGFFKQKDRDIRYRNLPDLQPYTIGVTLGYINTEAFDAATYLKKEAIVRDEQNIRKLALGRIDLALMDKYVGYYYLDNYLPGQRATIEFLEPPLENRKLCLMFSREKMDYQQKRKLFNQGLAIIRADGTMTAILERYGL